MTSLRQLAVIIPAYKPSSGLADIVRGIHRHGFGKIVVVNDGADESDPRVFSEINTIPDVDVLTHAVNLGKGSALKNAFNHVLVSYKDIKGVVTMDADGQHNPDDVFSVANTLLANLDSLILGVRKFKRNVPFRSQFGNILTKNIFHFLTGKNISDTQTGLRGIPTGYLKKLIPIRSSRYEFELDMLMMIAAEKQPIVEVPITTIYEDGNKSSHFNPLLDSFRIYFVFLRFIFVSIITFAVDTIAFAISYSLTSQIFSSMVVGRIAGFIVNLSGSKTFVFKSRGKLSNELVKYTILWMALFALSYTLMLLLVERWHFHVLASRIVVDSGLFFFNFLMQRDVVFSRKWRLARRD